MPGVTRPAWARACVRARRCSLNRDQPVSIRAPDVFLGSAGIRGHVPPFSTMVKKHFKSILQSPVMPSAPRRSFPVGLGPRRA
jgi:hypothetical protein